jgi:hypothetical protein
LGERAAIEGVTASKVYDRRNTPLREEMVVVQKMLNSEEPIT